MGEYMCFFTMKISAKSKKDLSRRVEITAQALSKFLHKKVEPHGYVELEKKDTVKNKEVKL